MTKPLPSTVDGVLVVAKPTGPTSHDVVGLVRRLSGTRRVGHGGTLDPFASGVLPVFLGVATRLVEYHLADRKAYRATICFGASSTTDDLEGELTPSDGPAPDRAAVEGARGTFVGEIEQAPPAYSAVKVAGRRAYARARAGEAVEIAPRRVTIHELVLAEWRVTDPDRPIAVVDVVCSAGTYVRALARDLGRAVGSAAYLGALVRTASGPFRIETAHPLDDVRAAASAPDGLRRMLLPPDAGLEMPRIRLSAPEVAEIARGRQVRVPESAADVAEGDATRLTDAAGRLVGIAIRRGARLAPDKVFVAADGAAADG